MRTFECSLTSAPFQQHLDEIAFQWQSCFNRTSWILQFFSPEYADLLFPWLKSLNNSFIHSLCIYWSYIFNHRAYHYIQVWNQLSLAHLYLTSLSKFATVTLLETYGFILIEKLLNSLFLNWLVILNDYIWQESLGKTLSALQEHPLQIPFKKIVIVVLSELSEHLKKNCFPLFLTFDPGNTKFSWLTGKVRGLGRVK